MTNFEKRILTLLYKEGALSKSELCRQGKMSWGTAVNTINSLLDKRLIERVGTLKRELNIGKNAYVFDLSSERPLVVGIDVNYDDTTAILTNVRGDILSHEVHKTPLEADKESIKDFFLGIIERILDRHVPDRDDFYGVGIGIPGLSEPEWQGKTNGDESKELENHLEEKLGKTVDIEINNRAYTIFEKWENGRFSRDDFMFVSVRNGLGSGIVLDGNLFVGQQRMAGKIGHLKTAPKRFRCKCGSTGCAETVVNQNYLYRKYREEVLKQPAETETPAESVILTELPHLFTEARRKNEAALSIVADTAKHLGICIATALMMFSFKNVVVGGHFGENGSVLLEALEKEVRKNLLSTLDFSLAYYPFDKRGFTRGAALLVIMDFFTGF
ncbi:MAG: ROK family transcriptional regulator [Proteobacteria bacterium]|nr:ROK family transcriptional regulator [Pseudomonadota bacterium]